MKIEISNGELIDKITILQIKALRITNPHKLHNIKTEVNVLEGLAKDLLAVCQESFKELKNINLKLWEIEDQIRELEKMKDFGEKFIDLARSVYRYNDQRAAIKRKINEETGSTFFEEKSYSNY